jgi:hypothetical protein
MLCRGTHLSARSTEGADDLSAFCLRSRIGESNYRLSLLQLELGFWKQVLRVEPGTLGERDRAFRPIS